MLCLTYWQRTTTYLGEHLFVQLEGSVTFSGSSLHGLKESGLAWFNKPPLAVLRGLVGLIR